MHSTLLEAASAGFLPAVFGIFAAVVALGLLIFAHEMGHFLVAKLSGVSVLKFSLGFGKKIVGWKIGETEYMVSVFPLGGYVKMLGEDEETKELSPEEKKRAFMEQPVWKRAAIVFAGPLFNILLAILLCYILFLTGFPTAIAKVDEVAPGSPAASAGFKPGDVIEKVDGDYVDVWEQVSELIKAHPGQEMNFSARRAGQTVNLKAVPADVNGKGDLGLRGSVVIGAVMARSPADIAGLKSKDHVLAVDSRPVGSWATMADIVKMNPGKTLVFTIDRGGKRFDTKITPKLSEAKAGEKQYGIIGVQMGSDEEKMAYGPIESLKLAAQRTSMMTSLTVQFLGRLIGGKEDRSQVGGPIAIVQLSGRQARQGPADFIIFIALLSVNLGVINLFPVPILDGGHLMFLGIEAIQRKPLSMRTREIAQQVGLFMLIALMVFVFYNDIMRVLGFSPMWK
ncbi:MAG: RIP metalloprotease RseP [Nitrospirota bacterium]